MKNGMLLKKLPLVVFAAVWILAADLKMVSAGPVSVAIMPFTVHAEKEMDFLKIGISEILESRISSLENIETVELSKVIKSAGSLKGPVSETAARELGKGLHAGYVIYGSLTVLGKRASIDARVIDTAGTGGPVSFFRQAESIDSVIPVTAEIAEKIGDKILADSRNRTAACPETESAQKAPEPAEDKVKFISRADSNIPHIWKSRDLDIRITGICAGDIDGDGKQELVVSSPHDLTIYRFTRARIEKIGEYKGRNYHKYLGVDARDINQNGKAEIFVSCQKSGSGLLDSFVVEWEQGACSPVMEGAPWYFRVLKTGKGFRLFGQRKGISDPFFPEFFEFSWNGSSYEPGKKQGLPEEISIFGLVPGNIARDDETLMAGFDFRDKICMFNPDGTRVWKSSERYGGSESFLEWISTSAEEQEDRFFLSQRILPVRSGSGEPCVITVRNDSMSSRFLKRFRSFSRARFVCLSWGGLGLSQKAETDEIAGYVPDFIMADFNNDGDIELVGAVVTGRGSILGSPQSFLAAFDMSHILERKE